MRVHLVDGTFELFRAHFAKRPDHVTLDGRPAKATVGIAASLLALLADEGEQVTHLAVAFDHPIRSFRNDLFAGYKTDEGVPEELLAQFGAAEETTRALGIVTWVMDRWEADDALATAATRWASEVDQVRILTPDKDLGQVLQGRRVVQVDRIRGKEIDEEALLSRRGIRPESVPDWLALVGDTADGIPGLPGFGEKTAALLLREFGHLEGIPGDASRWPASIRGAARLAATLAAERKTAELYRTLATLVRDVPLGETLADLEWRGAPREAFDRWCESAGAQDLRERPRRFSNLAS